MKVKRYIVNDMNEAMVKIKSELGIDAVILNTRKIKTGGLFRFFKKPLLEVVAAVDEPITTPPKKVVQPEPAIQPAQPVVQTPAYQPISGQPAGSQPVANQNMVNPTMVNQTMVNQPFTQANGQNLEVMKNIQESNHEIQELKQMVTSLIKKVERIENITPSVPTQTPEDKYIELLKGLDIQESIAKKIMEIVQRQININEKNHETIINAMKVIAREYLGDIKTIDTDVATKPTTYMFLGPTGVGKTTTLAKIAARLALVENKKIGLITADTYRIAAVEQLKTYSEILGIPLEVVYEADELVEALNKFKDKDYILIDTAGRSHKSKELKSDYDELTRSIRDVKVFLVLSMTTSFKDLKSIIESYSFLKDFRLLFTKLDEATSFGNILNMRVLTGKPLSYFTIGQSVPDDIEVADKERIMQYIFEQLK